MFKLYLITETKKLYNFLVKIILLQFKFMILLSISCNLSVISNDPGDRKLLALG